MKTLCSAILLSLLAQGPSSVGGVVQDPAGAALDAASVSILSARGSVIETVRTGPDGQFLFSPIRPGNYELSVEAPGFATKSQAVRLLPDRALQLQVRLNLQALSQEVTVTAELGSVAELARTPQQVTVIDKSEIDRRTTSVLAQVANDSVGVALQRTSPSIGGIYIRGLTGKNVVVYVDGIRYSTSAQRGGINTFLNLNEPTELRRVELLRGPSSGQYGSDGLGGTVQLLSQTPSMSSQGIEWHGETGIFGNTATAGFGANASQSLSTPRFGMVTSLSSRRNNTFRPGGGFDTNSSLNRFLGLSSTVYGTRLPDTAFTQFGGSLRLNFMIDTRTQLTASYKRNQQDGGKRYDQLTGGDGNNVAELRNLMLDFFYTRLDREFGNRFIDTMSLSFSYNRQREERVNQGGNGDPSQGIVSNFERLNAFGVQWRSNKQVSPRYEFFTGMEIYHESMAAPTSTFFPVSGTSSPSRGRVPDGARYIRAGIFSRHAVEVVPERLRFVGTIRYGVAKYRVEQSELWPADSMRTGDVSGNVGLVATAHPSLTFHFNYSRGFRAPSMTDLGTIGLTGDGFELAHTDVVELAGTIGNTADEDAVSIGEPVAPLRSEISNSFDLGFRYGASRLRIETTGFLLDLEDTIVKQALILPPGAKGRVSFAGQPIVRQTPGGAVFVPISSDPV